MCISTARPAISPVRPDPLPVLCWIFDADQIEADYGTCRYSAPVEDALITALSRIASSKSARIRDRAFPVFGGDLRVSPLYAVAVPATLPDSITSKLTRAFEGVRGYQGMELGQIPDLPLTRGFTYAHGVLRIHRWSESKEKNESEIYTKHGIRAEYFI